MLLVFPQCVVAFSRQLRVVNNVSCFALLFVVCSLLTCVVRWVLLLSVLVCLVYAVVCNCRWKSVPLVCDVVGCCLSCVVIMCGLLVLLSVGIEFGCWCVLPVVAVGCCLSSVCLVWLRVGVVRCCCLLLVAVVCRCGLLCDVSCVRLLMLCDVFFLFVVVACRSCMLSLVAAMLCYVVSAVFC